MISDSQKQFHFQKDFEMLLIGNFKKNKKVTQKSPKLENDCFYSI